MFHRSWDGVEESTLIPWDDWCLHDLSWWLDSVRLREGVSLAQVSPDLDFWSEASDVRWGTHLGRKVVSGRWSLEESFLPINAWELLVVERGLLHFQPLVYNTTVSIFADNSTAVAYLQKSGDSFSSSQLHRLADPSLGGVAPDCPGSAVHNGMEQCARRCSVEVQPNPGLGMDPQDGGFQQAPQKVAGVGGFVRHLSQSSMFTIFLTLPQSSGYGDRCSSPQLGQPSSLCLSSMGPDSSGPSETQGVLWGSDDVGGSVLASTSLVPGPSGSGSGSSGLPSTLSRSIQTAAFLSLSSWAPQAVASCLETIQRFARAEGFSSRVAAQVGLAHCPSSRTNYQLKWSVYKNWCRKEGHSISRPSLPKIADFLFWLRRLKGLSISSADFLFWLRRLKGLSISSLLGYRSMLAAVFPTVLLSISSDSVLRDLHSFKVEAPPRLVCPTAWDLSVVLHCVNTPFFKPLHLCSFKNLTKEVLFLVALATAKRVRELQVISRTVSFVNSDACLSYVPELVVKTISLSNPLPRSFLVKSLSDFAAGLGDDLLLCPIKALRIYFRRTDSFSPLPPRLFVSPCRPSRSLSKNASSFLREVIHDAGAGRLEVGSVRTHSIRGVSTSAAFHQNWSVSCVLESATWRTNLVFASFYLRDLLHEFNDIRSLGAFVAAGERTS